MHILVLMIAVMVGAVPVMVTAASGITEAGIAGELNGLAMATGLSKGDTL